MRRSHVAQLVRAAMMGYANPSTDVLWRTFKSCRVITPRTAACKCGLSDPPSVETETRYSSVAQQYTRQAYDSGHAQIVRVFYCQKAAHVAAYWLHLHCIITVNIRGVVAPQVML